jgi:hypothetical protein
MKHRVTCPCCCGECRIYVMHNGYLACMPCATCGGRGYLEVCTTASYQNNTTASGSNRSGGYAA